MAGLLGNLSKLIPGAEGMSDKDKRALLTQGLLQFGAGILANNQGNYGKAGPAIGAGLMAGMGAINKGSEQLADNRYKQQIMERQMGDPSEFRAMDLMARAAGHEPGSQGYKDFFRRNNGEIARQSSAAIQYRTEIGSDGRPRTVAYDPREVGAHVVGDGTTYGSGVSAPNPQQDFPALASNFGAQITSLQRSPADNARVGGVPNSQHMSGTAGDFVVPPQAKPKFIAAAQGRGYQAIDEGDHVHLELPPRPLSKPQPSGVNPFVGRRKEDEAAAVTAAQRGVELQYLPAELQARTDAAIATATGQAAANANAEIGLADAKRSRDAQDTLGLLGEAETLLTNATGSGVGALADSAAGFVGVSTSGAKATAALQTIAGQLISKMPRMEGPQSDKDVQLYKDMAGNLANSMLPVATRKAAAETIRRLNERYANGQQKAPSQGGTDPLGIL